MSPCRNEYVRIFDNHVFVDAPVHVGVIVGLGVKLCDGEYGE